MAAMADAGADGAHAHGEDSADSVPATNPAAEHTVPIDEKIKKDFNFTEFFNLASRVIDDGDADSMAALLNLKRRWSEKFGEDDSFGCASHGGSRPSRPLTFAAPIIARPARRFPGLPTSEQVALIFQGAVVPRSTRLEPPTIVLGTEALILQGTAAPRVLMKPSAAPTLGLVAHHSNVVSAPPCPLSTVALPSTCPLSTVALPAAAALNCSASFNLDASPFPLAAPRVSMIDLRPPSAMNVVSMGGFDCSSPLAMAVLPMSPDARNAPRSWAASPLTSTETAAVTSSPTQLLVSPLLGTPAVGITPATLPEYSVSPPRIWAAPPQQPAATAAPPLQPSVSWAPVPPLPSIGSALATSPLEILIGNVPLKPCSDLSISDDKITAAFHNSSRKTLTYIPPSVQNGEVLVMPTIDMIREGSNRWNTTAVGYFLGKRPYFHHLNDFVRSTWPAVWDVKATSNGFFFFQFKIMAAMEEVLEGGPWLYLGQPIVLQKWEPGMVLRKLKHTEVPVWIKLRHLPVELWTTNGLSTVASGIGRPLYPDAITRACTRLYFARVCVMLNVSSKLPKHIVIMMPNEHGGESACKVDVEYEWLPPKCTNCTSLGHATRECPLTKLVKPAVSIYVRKNQIPAPAPRTGDPNSTPDPVFDHPVAKDDMMSNERPHQRTDKVIWNVQGLNRRDHQVAVRDLVSEFRLHFIALLETRVMPSNVCRLQAGLLPRWRWFVDYSGPGNRIWIAWNDEFIDVDILDIGSQFVHCRVLMHDMHEPILLTVVYGANDVSTRRELWQRFTEMAVSADLPWLVGGDFNAVLDMGERAIFMHNCSTDGRSLWKRLDRMFVNDAWMEYWPNLFYTCLTPRTSDHSPLVLKGDNQDVQVAQKLLQDDRHSPLLLQLENSCMLVYLKAMQLENVMLRQRAKLQWLKGGDQCSKVFFRRVATRRANKRIFQISYNDGLVQIDPTTISSVFVTYFQGLLGGDWTDRALDLHYLRPWARHILTEEEACVLIRPVTVDDVKTAMFDIEEEKAPGPDGFSSSFNKAAWPIVEEEISRAIMDFFTTGRLLKQVNATLLTLIPKPLSECFCSGRLISDNVLLAQELFSGYNQCRLLPRCALKVDLRKAYDTVEWDFLFATLRLFGFPAVFIRWIEECVTSARFSVVVNGGMHRFFAGARGLRQGDPMSPYLFVLVMEVLQMILQQFIDQDGQFLYHWRCTELKLFQLSFADDLLLLCKADVRSVSLFRGGLDLFASLSGLHTNPQKSQLIISKAASGLRDTLLETLGFQEGHLPVRYLGRPLISARLSIADCQPLLQKIDSRIKGWEESSSPLQGIIKAMIKRLRTFLWKVPLPVATRRWLRRWLADQSRKVAKVRLRDCSIWTVKENKGAWGWRKMLTLRHILLSHIHFRVGDGTSFSLWHDPWHPLGPLVIRFPRGPQLTYTGPLDKLSMVMEEGQWNWPMITDMHAWRSLTCFPLFRRARTESFGNLMTAPSTPRQLMTCSTHRGPRLSGLHFC
ncbi:Retrovirus-related Pol polyprotein from type-2 retrotransposable element R2DM [Sesamum angolense]|uniref:Retrovirus-related Pol polyprotein from type-2 retrotransposable element R2DM n=1 Tax=Sesamum angolense TaxID=2727404 RepID=A0AAE1TA12_9LAMI|nr:Retrovirus-related Pol polyprotein from type-2 retrotransposable element R2DM [Sesamum angolense]